MSEKQFEVRPFVAPRKYANDPGGYYDRKDDEARHWSAELERAKAEGAWEHVVAGLEKRLEQARYVGD